MGCDGDPLAAGLAFFSLSVPFTALGDVALQKRAPEDTAVKCNLCCRESLCAVQSKYYSVIASSKEEL